MDYGGRSGNFLVERVDGFFRNLSVFWVGGFYGNFGVDYGGRSEKILVERTNGLFGYFHRFRG